MIKISNSTLISVFTKLLVLLVIAKSVSLGVWWYFPSDGVELSVKNNYQPKYQRVSFKNMIQRARVKQNRQEVSTTSSGISITNMILKGLYGTKSRGFVIVAMKSSPKKTEIIGINEVFKGYRLKSIHASHALFERDGSDFILNLQTAEQKGSITKVAKRESSGSVGASDAPRAVTRTDIAYYAKNPNQIWKEISIVEVKDGKKIKGFKVTRIDPNSRFAALGLQKNDLIIRANNINLVSYRDALEIYKNINKLDAIEIVVIRDNQEKELVYEIN